MRDQFPFAVARVTRRWRKMLDERLKEQQSFDLNPLMHSAADVNSVKSRGPHPSTRTTSRVHRHPQPSTCTASRAQQQAVYQIQIQHVNPT